MNHRQCVNHLLVIFATMGLIEMASSAQTPNITGHAFDAAGFPIPGVSITVTPQAGGIAKRTATSADGAYQFDNLGDDTYRIDFEIVGFDPVRRNHVRVRQDATANVDATLAVSSICECVNVTEPAELRARNGQVVDESGLQLFTHDGR